jgi:hypothetical protein
MYGTFLPRIRACKNNLMLKIVLKSQKKVRLEMWFGGENESRNIEFIWNNIRVKELSISIQITK